MVIRQAAEVLAACAAERGHAYRFGGEEFVVILPHTTLPVATAFAETLRQQFADNCIQHGSISVTATRSLGIATHPEGHASSLPELLKAADAALYAAKQSGRNR